MSTFLVAAVRFIVSAFVLMAVSWVVPGFSALGFGRALLAALLISVLGYLGESIMGEGRPLYSRGLIGFLSAAMIIYLVALIIPGMHVTVLGAILASAIIGLLDLVVPTVLR